MCGFLLQNKYKWGKAQKMVKDFSGGAVCFTFDDSRYMDWLSQRELFRKYNAHATFFYSGELTREHLDSMKELAKDGHSIGLHSIYHRNCDMKEENELEKYIAEGVLPQLRLCAEAGIKTESFAYPNNIHTEESDKALGKYFRHFRASLSPRPEPAKGYWIADCPQCFYSYEKVASTPALAGPGIGEYYLTVWENLDAALEKAAEENALIIFFSHGIHENAPSIHMPTATLRHCLEKASLLKMRCIGYDELP